jgi:hypothetical protein|tara:strand:+ start:726 stop:1670 length:945 start_codon:yes stop_codon:yes gene_type:complete
MIKLKDLLMEGTYAPSDQAGATWIDNKWYPAHTKAVLNWVRSTEYIPLTPKAVERALGKKIPIRSFHITGADGIEKMKNVIGKKKSISTFTRTHEDESLAKGRGVQTGMGGIICYVEGNLLGGKYLDFDTVLDKQGRRWVKAFHVFDKDPMIWRNELKRAKLDYDSIDDKMRKIDRKYHDLWIDKGEIDYNEYKELAKKEQGPVINKYVKDYIDLANKTLIKHKKLFKKSLINSDKNKSTAWWNELLVYNTKIIDIFVINRVLDKKSRHYKWTTQEELEKLLSQASGNKPITIGSPAQFRKWFKERKGQIDKRG